MSDVGASLGLAGQKVLDVHTDPDPGAGGNQQEEEKLKKYIFKYTTLEGYFLQDDPNTKAQDFEFMKTNFGLIQRPYDSDKKLPDHGQGMTSWQRFENHITSLNNAAKKRRHVSGRSSTTQHKLLFLGRHGNGYHNIAERYYGNQAWNCHYSALDGDPDGVMTWADAHLSEEGRRQAKEVNAFWKTQIEEQKMNLPQAYYVSPLDRAMETAEITFKGLIPSPGFQPTVMERLREGSGIHTCDRRSPVSYIRRRYPSYITTRDPLLTETDEFWNAVHREPDKALKARMRKFLDTLMRSEENERISFTSHSGAIGAMLKVLGHRQFSLGTGSVIPVLVRVDKIDVIDDKRVKRHGGKVEGGKHAQLDSAAAAAADDDDNEDNEVEDHEDDQSKWPTIPSCPADMDLENIGRQRWGMGLDKYLEGVEDGTLKLEEVAFR
ncbi:uncharacterized protein Z518_09692 [Rhinocladiella mackenziei CBS 650.93]|uniref:Phosphoglycerate mutase n=1 Tax=Rhinocladiella mackenziei CBS 650.93 TaxID=1442369 RepID=A0A0D2FF39_9EURO|nr:uncharacterized protein Z518_09692 [Rhinocladiella mackenziei CBS 650.93]KIX00627.1 hypothetical protein Z518_09692 [Rhinocladiella mackenziei CBS 650.93]